ncbi:MAG: hypothetical protein JXM73_24215 [Anaerolineae bacterium]|nr:hypothetical protein [Anaerolineae bacterium]
MTRFRIVKQSRLFGCVVLCVALAAMAGSVGAQGPAPQTALQAALGTEFTYQGHLEDGGSPANGSYDLLFTLYDAGSGGAQVGNAVSIENVTIADGMFVVSLDFGAVAFDGQARYLEAAVRPGSSTASYIPLSPRQALTAAPYALYAAKVPWSGLAGVPAGFADGDDADTLGMLTCTEGQVARWDGLAWDCDSGPSHSAGPGLILNGNQFEVSFAGSGASNDVARSDHHHLGQTWTGADNPLKIDGSFGAPDNAALVLSNSHAAGDGLRVFSAGDDGIYVRSAGNPSRRDTSTQANGLEIEGAQGHGIFIGRADRYGVFVSSAGNDGVYVGDATGDGVHVYSAGSPTTRTVSALNNGLEVEGAAGHGLYVGHADQAGVYVASASADAGYFNGDVTVTGNLTKGGGAFQIDHPLDPENKTLSHSFVESPDMMNIYNGNVMTDKDGFATVTLPDYFEALNKDYCYQLTVIGTFAQAIIAQEIENNRFVIQTDKPEVTVSWQVTGVRHDPYAEANRIVVEQDKPLAERGTYLHPQAYALPQTRDLAEEAQP